MLNFDKHQSSPLNTTKGYARVHRYQRSQPSVSLNVKWSIILTLKELGGEGAVVNLTLTCGFSKNVSSKEMVKPCFFFTFSIILKRIFPENFIEFPQY